MDNKDSLSLYLLMLHALVHALGEKVSVPPLKFPGKYIVSALSIITLKSDLPTQRRVISSFRFLSREHEKLPLWVNKNISVIDDFEDIADIKKLSLKVELESFEKTPKWFDEYYEKISLSNDIHFLSNVYSFATRYVKSKRYFAILSDNFTARVRFLRKLSLHAKSQLNKCLEAETFVLNNVKKSGVTKVVFIIGAMPASVEATHLNLITSVAKTIKQACRECKVYLAITGEGFLDAPHGDIRYTDQVKDGFRKHWESLNPEEESVYTSSCLDLETFKSWITCISPDLVISVGGSYQSEVCSTLASKKFPVIFLPASNSKSNSIAFPVNAVIARNKEIQSAFQEELGEENCFYLEPITNVILNDDPYLGPELKKGNDFLAAVVLNANRVSEWFEGLSTKEINSFVEIFHKASCLRVLIVGETKPEKIVGVDKKIKKLVEEERLVIMGGSNTLRGIYKHIDLIFTLPGVYGGGGAVTAAIHDRVPAICWKMADVSWNIPESYHYSDSIGLFENLCFFAKNEMACKKNIEDCQEHLSSREEGGNLEQWRKAIDCWLCY
ncbi:hypothetical protein [Halomonas elongata]|uniref:Uncharacterized protein n=1 Tax=Halomonas elongata (strain ATCC 33173 / DSM 2581 / NBRC 15536 / NCIMB 2198 / 1H9) TaxID=768066 RepID=A0A1R4A498_HALED|nr:hypothetical protein [Halomonas elongata]WBF19558.1 hypothetical protein LM502_07680 [Halomonas elongata]WPU48422.1 hypothetical protein SR933_05905 [Halomonas elongata DSM 2581]SJK83788.1 uncharacterized protein HELO_2397D [Halomonas elongata DSM 2581]